MFGQRPGMLPSLLRSCRIQRGCSRERCVEVVVGLFKQTMRCVEKCSCLRGRCDRLPVITCMKARLQLTKPIPAGRPDEGRTLVEMLLEADLVERVVAKRAELRCQSS